MKVKFSPLRCLCKGEYFRNVFTYDAPPEGEVRFQFSSRGSYRREVLKCDLCGHFVSTHNMDASTLYNGDYVDSNYRDDEGLKKAFEHILSLDSSRSDNMGRVKRVLSFAETHFPATFSRNRPLSVLDVGSGLCVFLHRMKEAGWDCTALDPDTRAARHARDVVGVRSICGDFGTAQEIGLFDLVTFNRVLEHLQDPVRTLAKSAEHLFDGGFVYIEVPDGEAAVVDGPGREEFFIDHWHVFSSASLALTATGAGFLVKTMERLREPSGKYTLRAFLICPSPFPLPNGEREG